MANRPSLASSLFQNSPPPRRASNSIPIPIPNSPWSGSEGNDFDSLTLPPINPDVEANHYDLPPFNNNPQFFGLGPSGSLSPVTFASNIQPPQGSQHNQHNQPEPQHDPPLLNQQPSWPQPQTQPRRASFSEQYHISSSPDRWGSFIDLDDLQALDDFEGIFDFNDASPSQSPTSNMPVQTRTQTRRSSIVDLTDSPIQPVATQRKRVAPDTAEGAPERKVARRTIAPSRSPLSVPPKSDVKDEDIEVVDLAAVENDEQYKEAQAKQAAELAKKQALDEATRPVKLAQFNCIICMDQPTDLTVTHCGHMFCSECLHQALYAGDKKSCPVCRTAISTASRGDKKQSKNGIFVLEMKLMTKNRKGKQPVRPY